MSNLLILRTYASKDPASLPSSILFRHSETSLTIYDAFPKSIFHFLILPRISKELGANKLTSLQSLCEGNREHAKNVISLLKEDATNLKKEIHDEMLNRYGFKWDIWIGFHAVPSMQHLHLHVLSADLVSEKMKHKKHYNSFHPKLGFFLHVDEVLSWFDSDESIPAPILKRSPKSYEVILKEDLSCFHCESSMRNVPTLKTHLQEEWDKLLSRGNGKLKRKRKIDEDPEENAVAKRSQNVALPEAVERQ